MNFEAGGGGVLSFHIKKIGKFSRFSLCEQPFLSFQKGSRKAKLTTADWAEGKQRIRNVHQESRILDFQPRMEHFLIQVRKNLNFTDFNLETIY